MYKTTELLPIFVRCLFQDAVAPPSRGAPLRPRRPTPTLSGSETMLGRLREACQKHLTKI